MSGSLRRNGEALNEKVVICKDALAQDMDPVISDSSLSNGADGKRCLALRSMPETDAAARGVSEKSEGGD